MVHGREGKWVGMKNATAMVLFGFSYLVLFGFLIGITGLGSLNFSFTEVVEVILASVAVAIVSAVAISTAMSTKVLETGTTGEYVWRGAIYGVVVIWSSYFVLKLTNLMPSGTPAFISIVFLGPPLVALLWGMFATFLKSGAEG